MAKRYSGNLKINVIYDDHNFYRASVSRNGKLLWRGIVGPVVKGIGYDSPQAYDEVASAAISFADNEVGGIGDEAEYNENLAGYLIRRTPRANTGKMASHATRRTNAADLMRDMRGARIQRTQERDLEETRGSRSSTARGTKPQILVRKVESRWQPVTRSGVIVRGNVYNADGLGYSTKQGAEEAAVMIRKLGKTA